MRWTRKVLLLILIIAFVVVFFFNVYLIQYEDAYAATSHRLKAVGYILFLIILSIEFALLEIQIEGKHGWAQKLPTWVYSPDWLKNIFKGKYLTGYHTLLFFLFLPAFFHLPVFFTKWDIYKECIVFGSYFFFLVIEDFMWFALNPEFGLKKFTPKNKKIWWHNSWFGPIPDYYLEMLLVSAIFFSIGLPHL